nr:MAG TPA: putative transposase [Caudoviricetes sp.]DAT59529.1 MAG TPA: putative transposase [Caudoviricetes sp.]
MRWFVRWLLIKQRQLVCNHDDLEVHEIGSFETYQTCKRCGKCGKLGDF